MCSERGSVASSEMDCKTDHTTLWSEQEVRKWRREEKNHATPWGRCFSPPQTSVQKSPSLTIYHVPFMACLSVPGYRMASVRVLEVRMVLYTDMLDDKTSIRPNRESQGYVA